MITISTDPFTIAAGRNRNIGEFKGQLYFKNESSTARAKFRVVNVPTNEVVAEGELENIAPGNETDCPIKAGFKDLTIYNDSDKASIQVTPKPF